MQNNNEDLNLLVLTELFLPTKGGTAVWFDKVYRHLGGKGIHIVTARVPDSDKHDREHPNTVHRMNVGRVSWLWPEALPIYMKFFLSGLWIGTSRSIEAIHAGRVLPEGLVGLWLSRLMRKPLVVYAHGEEITTWTSPRRQRAMRTVYCNASTVIANSRFTYGLLRDMGVDSNRLKLIYPGVDMERFQSDGPKDNMLGVKKLHPGWPLVVSVGRLSRRKGFDKSIEAISRLRDNGMDLDYVIIGVGDQEEELRQLVKAFDVQDRVHMLGHVEEEHLPGWLRRADLFLMPNREINGDTEGFGMVFVEAAACGTPSIAGLAGGTGDAVVDGETGLRVNGDNVADIANAIERLLLDREYLKELSESAHKRACAMFSWERVAELTHAIHR